MTQSGLIGELLKQFEKGVEDHIRRTNVPDPVQWIEGNFYIPETRADPKLRGRFVLQPYQRDVLEEALSRDEKGNYKYSLIVWSDIKKSAKSTIAAAVNLYRAHWTEFGEFYVIANDLKQADSRVNYYLRRAIALNPKFEKKYQRLGYRTTAPTGSFIEAIPIDPSGEAGSNADQITFSELWGANESAKENMWCLDEETEILTENGWKRGVELTRLDQVAVYDRGSVKWEHPSRKTKEGPQTTGGTIHWAAEHDFFMNLLGMGTNRANSRMVVELAGIQPDMVAHVFDLEGSSGMSLEKVAALEPLVREAVPLAGTDSGHLFEYFANKAMWKQRVHGIYALNRRRGKDVRLEAVDLPQNRSWRPFQLAFIMLAIPSLADPSHSDRTGDGSAVADLLWFPTGGGKTEAYLGVAAYAMAIRRLQGAWSKRWSKDRLHFETLLLEGGNYSLDFLVEFFGVINEEKFRSFLLDFITVVTLTAYRDIQFLEFGFRVRKMV